MRSKIKRRTALAAISPAPLFAAFMGLFLLICTGKPAFAESNCPSLSESARLFFESAGLQHGSELAWFRECVHPNMRSDSIWSTLSEAAITARNAGLKLDSVRETGGVLRVDLGTITYAIRVTTNNDGQIISLDGTQMATIGSPLEDLAARLAELPGDVSVLVTHAGKDVIANNAEMPMQVSSSMKLGILRTLLDDVAAGRLKLDETVEIKPELKALPSGTLHQLPNGTSFTLNSLASFMMRDSDNTASDMLINRLGVDRVAATLGLPFIMTFHQWFMMKSDSAFYDNYRYSDGTSRKSLLQQTVPKVPLNYSESYGHATPEAGWYLSTRKLCELASSLSDSDLFDLESAFVQYPEWSRVMSKAGGDETSRNDTLWVKRLDGEAFCLSMTWNTSEEIYNDQRYIFLLTSFLEALRRFDVPNNRVGLDPF